MQECPNGGKKIFDSKNHAKHARDTISRASREMRVYECPYCHGWHLTGEMRRRR